MKISLGGMGLIFVGLAGWRIGETLHPDAVGMLIGLLFGMLMGLPALLIVLASNQRPEQEYRRSGRFREYPQQQPRPQPPKIEIHNHFYGEEKQTVDQLLEEIEQIEWVRQLSTGSAPKRITTNQYSNSREF